MEPAPAHRSRSDSDEPTIARAPAPPLGGDVENPDVETYNPWSIVNLVFHHLADQGLHPVLGSAGYPGAPAAELLRCLGIRPAAEGNRQVHEGVRRQLADIRKAMFEEPAD
jgi:hypothetical protein